jgi:hypothetical protein
MADIPARRDEAGLPATRQGYAGFQVTGKNPDLWKKLHLKFIAKIEQVIEQLVEEDAAQNWLQEQAREFGTLALDHMKAKLRKSGLEAEQIEAEVAKLFAEKERVLAEARKTNAEARAIEIQNEVKELRLALGMAKAVLIGEQDEVSIVFGQQIEAMLNALKAVGEV